MSSQPEYLAEFSHLREAALRVGALVFEIRNLLASSEEANRNTDSNTNFVIEAGKSGGGGGVGVQHQVVDPPHIELEGRLGRLTSTGFNPDIGSSSFCLLLQMLEAFPRWSRIEPWEESQDVFYTVDLPGSIVGDSNAQPRPLQVRSSIKAKTQVRPNETEAQEISVSHIVKKKCGRVDLYLQSVDVGCCALETRAGNFRPVDARISLSMEFPVPSDLLPMAVTPEFVRIKQRKRFFLGSLGVPGDCFSFDLSVVYKGHTRTEAEALQQKGDGASFEVECECLAPNEYLDATNNDATCLGLSILLKLLDFASTLNPSSPVTFVPSVNDTTKKAGNGFSC